MDLNDRASPKIHRELDALLLLGLSWPCKKNVNYFFKVVKLKLLLNINNLYHTIIFTTQTTMTIVSEVCTTYHKEMSILMHLANQSQQQLNSSAVQAERYTPA